MKDPIFQCSFGLDGLLISLDKRSELLLTIKRETSGGGRKMPIVVGKEPEAVSWLVGQGRGGSRAQITCLTGKHLPYPPLVNHFSKLPQ